jgi:hypothetical protein
MESEHQSLQPPLTVRADGGWSVDSVVVGAPSGRAVLTLTVRPAASDADAAEIAAQHGGELAAQAPGLVAKDERMLDAGGTPVVAKRYRAGANGADGAEVTFLYAAAGGQARIASLAAQGELDAASLRAAADIVAGAAIIDAPRRMTVAYSPEELAVLAGLLGVRSLPGVTAPPADGHAGRDAARRSLLARGVVRRAEDGRLVVHPAQRDLLGTLLRPRVVVSAEARDGERREVRLLYAGDAIGVTQARTPDGIHVFTTFPARELVGQSLAAAALRPAAGATEHEPMTVDLAELERLEATAGRADGESANGLPRPSGAGRLRVLRRAGERVEGGDLRWLDAGDAGVWSADVTDDGRVLLTPVEPRAIAERFAKLAS